MCSRGIPETGRLPAGTGRGAAQWSQASTAYAHWGFCEYQQNMLPGSTTVSSLSSLHPRSILLTGSHHFNPLPSAARSGFHIRVCTEEPFITEYPQTIRAGISFQGYGDYPGGAQGSSGKGIPLCILCRDRKADVQKNS